MLPRILAILAVVAALGEPARAQSALSPPLSPAAQEHYDRGVAFYQSGDYEAAASAFEAAYALDPRREVLFAWAQAERLGGDCATATTLYRRILADDPPTDQAEAVRTALARCEPPAEPPPPPPPPPEPRPVAGPSPWYTDVAGGLLVGSGLVGLAVGGWFYAASSDSQAEAEAATVYRDAEEAHDRARTQRTVAAVALGAGAGLVLGGVIRYATRDGGERRDAPQVSAWFDGERVMGVVCGSF